MLRDLHKGWNQSSPSSWSVSRLERSEPKPEVELLEKKSESSRVSRSLGRIEFLLDSFLDFCSLSSSFSFSLAAASCFELCTPWERNEFCFRTICNYDWYHLCDCHDDVFQKGNPLAQNCHFFLDIFCTLEKRKLIMENKWIPTVSVFLLPFLQTLPFVLCVSASGEGWQSRRASGLPRFCSSPGDKLHHLVINHFISPLLKVPLT